MPNTHLDDDGPDDLERMIDELDRATPGTRARVEALTERVRQLRERRGRRLGRRSARRNAAASDARLSAPPSAPA